MACEDCKPCPWCGGEIELEEFGGGDDWWWGHFCENRDACGWQSWMGRNTCPVCQEEVRLAVPVQEAAICGNRTDVRYKPYPMYTFCKECTERHKGLLEDYNQYLVTLAGMRFSTLVIAAEEGYDWKAMEEVWEKYVLEELGPNFVPTGIIYTARWKDENETRDNTPE